MNMFYSYLSLLLLATSIPGYLALCELEKAFVDGHNLKRLAVARGQVYNQPAAADMKMMVWDYELQAKAEAWVNGADPSNHNPDKTVPSGRFTTGENIYWLSTTDPSYKLNPAEAIDSWFDEHANYTYGPLTTSDFDGSKNYKIGHYTQLVWADTIFVGCAGSRRFEGGWYTFYVVCDYGPSGNYYGQVPYEAGPARQNLLCDCSRYSNCNCDKPYGNNC